MRNWKMQMGSVVAVGLTGMVFAQGSLTPPGAPGTTMKTLGQLDTSIVGVSNRVEVVRSAVATAEPRTPISSATTITQPGSYYLIRNITVASGDGITISTNEVTLDLNGFMIESTAASATGYGVLINGTRRNIAIANGFIKGGTTWNGSTFSGGGFNYGIYSASDANITVSKVVVERCFVNGIYLSGDDATAAVSCTVRTCGGYGIVAGRVESSIVLECGNTAISGDQVSNCRGWSVLAGYGIYAETVCGSFGRTDKGIYGITATTVQDSYGYAFSSSTSVFGISATTVNNSYGYGSSSGGTTRGIYGKNINNSYGFGSCNGSYAGYGIDADTVQNSYGYCSGDNINVGYGINAYAVGNSHGVSIRSVSGSRGILSEGPVADSYAVCDSGHAIQGESALNCRGQSTDGVGIYAYKSAMNCVGISSINYGVYADTAGNCYGYGGGDLAGIYANAVNVSRGISVNSDGIVASVVNSSRGDSDYGRGIYSTIVNNSYGFTFSGSPGLYAVELAIGCYGYNRGSGIGISGYILNSCRGASAGAIAVSYTYKYNMP